MAVIRGTALKHFPELVAELGSDSSSLLVAAQIDPDDVGRHDRFISLPDGTRLLETAANLLNNARGTMDAGIVAAKSLDDLPDKLIRIGWCGSEECGHQIEDRTDRNIIGTPVEDEGFKGMCAVCGKPTTTPVYIARAM